jgi:seryl-tRNA synthetase
VTCRLQVIEVDVEWRQLQFKVDNLRAEYGKKNKEVAAKKKAKEDADDLIAEAKDIDASIKVTAVCAPVFSPSEAGLSGRFEI